jgi:glycosyltransferase involved in cell wall biosynthesis
MFSATKFVNGLIKKECYKFDVVCVHDWLSSIAGLIIKNETKMPVVFHVHSTESGRSGGHGSEVVSHFESATAETADCIITVSHAMRDDLIRQGWPAPKISVVWNGVDPERYNPNKCRPEDVEKIERNMTAKRMNAYFFLRATNMGQGCEEPHSGHATDLKGIPLDSMDSFLDTKLKKTRAWIIDNKDSNGLVNSTKLAEKITNLGEKPQKIVAILKKDGVIADSPEFGKFMVV